MVVTTKGSVGRSRRLRKEARRDATQWYRKVPWNGGGGRGEGGGGGGGAHGRDVAEEGEWAAGRGRAWRYAWGPAGYGHPLGPVAAPVIAEARDKEGVVPSPRTM